MKKIIFSICLVVGVLAMSGCADFLERECTVRNPNELTTLDMLNLFGVFLQVMNYESDLSQASNADIAKHLQEQDRKYLDKIIANQNRIISMLEESIATK